MTQKLVDRDEPESKPSANGKASLERDIEQADLHIREGRFQRWLALAAGASSVLSGLEVSYEHYKGSYSRPVMYTPVILSGALALAGTAAFSAAGPPARSYRQQRRSRSQIALSGFTSTCGESSANPEAGVYRLPTS